jgi:glutamate carboxypeptidase
MAAAPHIAAGLKLFHGAGMQTRVAELDAVLGLSSADATARVLERVRPYVEHETPSGDEAALNALSERIASELATLGARTRAEPAPGLGRNLLAEFDGTEPDAAPVVVLAHIDTVHPKGTLETMPFHVGDAHAAGPGIYDMKTGLAVAVEAVRRLRETGRAPRRPLTLFITCDEEIGSHSARAGIERLAGLAHAVLVPEPCVPGGGVKTQRKGVATYELRVLGRAAHAGIEPGRAVSAITELANQIRAMLALADHELGTTINVGVIRGGTASNVVAAHAYAAIDVRLVTTDEGDRVHAALEALRPTLAGASLKLARTEYRPPLERSAGVVGLWEHARALAAGMGVELPEGASGGGSDGSLAAAAGAATLDGLGPDGGGAHAADEHILIADLPFRLALMTRLLETL